MVAAALLAVASSVRAQESAVTEPGLNWVRLAGADDCLSAAELADKVEVRVGRTMFVATTEAELFVDGSVTGTARDGTTDRTFNITLQVSRPGGEVLGERVLAIDGESCRVIDDAVSLVIAVTLYPRSSLVAAGIPLDPTTAASLQSLFGDEPTDPDPSSLPSVVVTPMPRAKRAPPREPAERNGTRRMPGMQLSFDAVAAGEIGQLPDVRLAVGGYFRVFPRDLVPIEVGAAYYFTSRDEVREGGSVRFELATASLTGCPWTVLSQDLRGCLGIEGGVLTAAPSGLAVTAERSTDPVLNILFAAVYRPHIVGPLHVRAAAILGVPILQHEFLYQARDGTSATLFQTSQIQGRADIGLGLSF
jgi:hypothetical protein